LQDDEAAFVGATSLAWLPNIFCRERNYDNCHDDQCSHLHPQIVGESGFVAGLCVHLSPPSRIIAPRALRSSCVLDVTQRFDTY
jgi:hypothetical protein